MLHTNLLFIIESLLIGRCSDDVLTVSAQLDQMIQLLQLEISSGNNNSETRILDTILSDSDNILAQVNHHFLKSLQCNLTGIFLFSDCWLGQKSSMW